MAYRQGSTTDCAQDCCRKHCTRTAGSRGLQRWTASEVMGLRPKNARRACTDKSWFQEVVNQVPRTCTRTQKTCSVPALKTQTENWKTTVVGKAKLLATTFATKYTLPTQEENCYSTLTQEQRQEDWQLTTQKETEKVLKNLREESETGPDLVPTQLLHHCATQLAEPLQTCKTNT